MADFTNKADDLCINIFCFQQCGLFSFPAQAPVLEAAHFDVNGSTTN